MAGADELKVALPCRCLLRVKVKEKHIEPQYASAVMNQSGMFK
jgi:hypothetical protein